jgi:hypothetical protein
MDVFRVIMTLFRAAPWPHMFQTSATELSHLITAKRWTHYPDTYIISAALTLTNSTAQHAQT